MITKFFIPELNNHDIQELWFQQDGATCHTTRATIDLLKDTFGDRLISRFGPVNWPPRSCDLTPLDYFLWGYVKSLVYADKPQTLDHLENNIRRVIADIRPQMLEKVIENWTSRLDFIRASHGSPMPEIIFKMGYISALLLRFPKGENSTSVAQPYNLGKSTISDIKKAENPFEILRQNLNSEDGSMKRKTMREANDIVLDHALEKSYGVVRTTIRVLSYSTTAA
ncbi:putative DD41D transposase [Trichonephila clavipes]|nr:putative DD41D transposase [Trichonephila clavipes]